MTKLIGTNRYRVTSRRSRQWGIVKWTGSEWLAESAFYQGKASRGGPIVKPMSKRMPRYRRVGFYNSLRLAIAELKQVLG